MTVGARRWLTPVLGLGVTGFFAWLFLRQADMGKIGAALSGISILPLLIAVGFLAVGYTIRIFRWWWILRTLEPKVTFGSCAWPFLVSISLNNLLPFRAGDAVRVMGFRNELRSSAMRLLGTLFIERLLDLMTLLAVFFVCLLGVAEGKVPENFVRLASMVAAAGVVAVFGILLFSRAVKRLIHRFADNTYFVRHGWSETLKRSSDHFLDVLGLLRTPVLTFQLIGLSLLVWLFEGAVFATVAHSLTSQLPLASAWFALATGTLATLLPSSPGYVGTFDYFTMLGLVAYGADRDHAAAFAIIVHVILWLPLTVVGMMYFLRPGARMLRQKAASDVSS